MLDYVEVSGEIAPSYLGEADTVWLRALLDAYERHVGHQRRELEEHLQAPLSVACDPRSLRRARLVLDRIWPTEPGVGIGPRRLREELFLAAAEDPDRERVVERVARRLGLRPRVVMDSLFADLPPQRRLAPMPAGLSPWELALRVNQATAQSVLRRSRRVLVELVGNARALVAQARWGGLMAVARPAREGAGLTLEISGPLSLFCRSLVYGRTLAALLPLLTRCDSFLLRADCEVGDRLRRFVLRSTDPVFPAAEPRRFASQVEARFFRDFAKLAPDWDIIREPEPLVADRWLLFPDFALWHRRQRWRRWLLEIVGYWTQDYLRKKMDRLRLARRGDLILAVDRDRRCGPESEQVSRVVSPEEVVGGDRVIWYRRRVDPEAVLRILEGQRPGLPRPR